MEGFGVQGSGFRNFRFENFRFQTLGLFGQFVAVHCGGNPRFLAENRVFESVWLGLFVMDDPWPVPAWGRVDAREGSMSLLLYECWRTIGGVRDIVKF
jgi:hypothetical protein